jgi:hypothetical protein
MKPPMTFLRLFFYLAAVFAGAMAVYLALQTRDDINGGKVCATDSGATGFAIFGGLALLALSITFLRKND